MAEEMRKGLGGFGKLHSEAKKPAKDGSMKGEEKPEHEQTHGAEGEEKTTTITHHADGTHTMEHDGESSDHPHHMHLASHLAHKLSGGDAHHVTHHDGMEAHSHTVDEQGEHADHEGDPHESLAAMMGGGMQDEGAMGEQHPEHPMEPTYGGM